MITVLTEFIKKATVRVVAYVYNEAGNLVDPTHLTTPIRVTIYDPDGTVTATEDAAMDSTGETGIYDYYFATDADTASGWYRGVIEVMDGTDPVYTTMGTFSFRIK